MTIRAVIVDDEQLARQELEYLLRKADDVEIVAQGKNGVEAVELVRAHQPDVVFLDVQMPGLDGFAVLKKLLEKGRKSPLPNIVFATAFDRYAVRAFEVNAVDYLLKPFDEKRVRHTLERVRTRLAEIAVGVPVPTPLTGAVGHRLRKRLRLKSLLQRTRSTRGWMLWFVCWSSSKLLRKAPLPKLFCELAVVFYSWSSAIFASHPLKKARSASRPTPSKVIQIAALWKICSSCWIRSYFGALIDRSL